ncbi:MAG: outer membrane protein OmpA-like peptidoglycan-associated protein [Psychromonas sp.]|jgi:outer membrane protein OmpA-like peptidoglycan-associated protein
MSSNNKSIVQKSTISMVILSVIAVGIITLQDHFNKGYLAEQNHTEQINNHAPIETISLAEPEEINLHAQSKLISEAAIAEPIGNMSLPSKESVLFALGSAQIKPDYFTVLSATAKQIKMSVKDEQIVWQIVGHADHSGTAQFNLKLAKQRAQTVADFLLNKGVEQAQLSVLSLGESAPVTLDPIRTSNPVDRRVEIHLYQAEIATLAKQLNRAINPSDPHKQKIKQLQAPRVEQVAEQVVGQVAGQIIPSVFAASVLAKRRFAFKQQQAFVKTSAVFTF